MGGTVSSNKITNTAKLAQHASNTQNDSLQTTSAVNIPSRQVGAPWHASNLGVGQILGLQGLKLTNTSHATVGLESFRSKNGVERTPVKSVHTPPDGQVLPPGPVDGTVDFTGLRGEISAGTPSFGKSGSGIGFGGGNGLASADIRDLMKNKKNYSGWARHGGVDPKNGVMQMPIPPFYDKVPMKKVQLKQQYPKRVSNATAQGFFDD
jgi:hypothetical protein